MKFLIKLCCFLVLISSITVVKADDEYKVVSFKKNDACSLFTPYHSVINNTEEKLNGCYGIDAAYIKTIGNDVYFVVGGDYGYTNIDNVELLSGEAYQNNLSVYETRNGYLYHNIKNDLDSKYYAYSIKLGQKPSELLDNHIYYSYDGNYFYYAYNTMIDDYANDTYEHSINKNKYENYYQYTKINKSSNYSLQELENYVYDVLGIDGMLFNYKDNDGDGANDYVNKSQLFDNVECFKEAENKYQINSALLLSIALHESNYGKSRSAYERNNLFNVAAYQTEYEKMYGRFMSIDDSVDSYCHYYLVQRYLNEGVDYLGNKKEGINASYSKDPYWSEKVASMYAKLDEKLGYKEINDVKLTDNSTSKDNEKTVKKIELIGDFPSEIALGDSLDLKDLKLKVQYEKGSDTIPLTSEMVTPMTFSMANENSVLISYGGESIEKTINVSQELNDLKDELINRIDECVRIFKKYQTYDDKELKYISSNYSKIRPQLTFEQIRYLDLAFKKHNDNLRYIIDENDLELSISGLGFSLNKNKDKFLYQFYDNTYHVDIIESGKEQIDRLKKFVTPYGFETIKFFNISYRYNLKQVSLDAPIIVQVKLDDKKEKTNYAVYVLDEEGNIKKCKTTYSKNYLQFMSEDVGTFVLLALEGANTIELDDGFENLSFKDNNEDTFNILLNTLLFIVLCLYAVVSLVIYFEVKGNREKRWNAYRKSLQRVVIVQEEKPKI